MSERCEVCDRPRATDEQWRDVPPGERDDLCWGREQCEAGAVDWRERATLTRLDLAAAIARAERAEAQLAALRAHACIHGYAALVVGDVAIAATADAYRERIEAPLRAEVERLTAERDDATARTIHSCHAGCSRPMCVLRRERDTLRAEVERLTVTLASERAARKGVIDDALVATCRAREAERDTLAAALAEVREAWACRVNLACRECGGQGRFALPEKGMTTRCSSCRLWREHRVRDALAAPPADLAAERDRRVRAPALDEAADVLGEYDDWHNQDGAAWLRARAAEIRGGR